MTNNNKGWFQKQVGGEYNDEKREFNYLINNTKKIIESVRSQFPRLPPIHFGILNDLHLRAFTEFYKDEYYIAITIGTLRIIEDLTIKINAAKSGTKGDYPKLSIHSGLYGVPEYFPEKKPHYVSFENIDFSDFEGHRHIIYTYIIYHELCHIFRGHILLKRKCKEINKSLFNDDLLKDINFLQTLEMDADSFATTNTIYDLLFKRMIIPNIDLTFFNDLKSFIYNFIYCIYGFIRLTDFEDLNVSDIKKRSHPKPAVRISLIFDNIKSILEKENIQIDFDLIENNVEAAFQAEKDFVKITSLENKLAVFAEVYGNSEILDYKIQIVKNFQIIKEELKKYSYSEIKQ